MCPPIIAAVGAAAAVVGTGASIIQGNKAAQMQQQATNQAQVAAAQTKAANERALNQANSQRPDLSSIFAQNLAVNSKGVGSTMLTGPQGLGAPSGSLLGKSTLLGG